MERERKRPKNRSFSYEVKDQPREELNFRDSSRQIHQHLAKNRRFDQNMEKRRCMQDIMDGSERRNPQNCQSQCGGEVGRRQEKRKMQNVYDAGQMPKDGMQFERSQQFRRDSTRNGHWHEVKRGRGEPGQTKVNESPMFRIGKSKRCWEGQAEAKDGEGFHHKRKQGAAMEYSAPKMTLQELDKKLAEYDLPTQTLPVKSMDFNYPQNCHSQCGGEVGRKQEKSKMQNVHHARQMPKDGMQFERSQQFKRDSTKDSHSHEVKMGRGEPSQTKANKSPVFRSRKRKRFWEGQAEAKDGDVFDYKRKRNADMEYSPPRMTLEELDKKLAEYDLPTQSLPVKSMDFNYPQNCQSQFGRSQHIRGDSTKDGHCPEVKRSRGEAGQSKANESPVFRSRKRKRCSEGQAEDEDGFQPKRQRVADIDFSSPRITLEELVKKLSEIHVESRPIKSMDVNHPGTQDSSVEDMEVD
ncbi:Hypothetical predicted protein [Pelobates cultripes]|uniref:Uncharacterized protein n=1 Tax=Pelobates cultripes TaxID=61616 RepID=A0AAD1TD77_PELCU|nr:Hypothetical predicted protein [Pelobates cultripes]